MNTLSPPPTHTHIYTIQSCSTGAYSCSWEYCYWQLISVWTEWFLLWNRPQWYVWNVLSPLFACLHSYMFTIVSVHTHTYAHIHTHIRKHALVYEYTQLPPVREWSLFLNLYMAVNGHSDPKVTAHALLSCVSWDSILCMLLFVCMLLELIHNGNNNAFTFRHWWACVSTVRQWVLRGM